MTLNPTKLKINSELTDKLLDLFSAIQDSRGIIITGHINPDGDDVGSQLALAEYLRSIGKKFCVIDDDNIPKQLRFLPHVEMWHHLETVDIEIDDYDMLIVVDSGDPRRTGRVLNLINEGIAVINIDHHLGNSLYGDINIVVDNACSIGEILYYFFIVNEIEITRNIAIDLYVSIVTDTGSFRYDQMHPAVHLIAADLLEKGVVPADYNIALYQSKSIYYVQLQTLLLSRIELHADNRIACSFFTYDDFMSFPEFETEGLIENIGTVDTVSVYFTIKEKHAGFYNASLRSKFNVDVSKVASHFGGGGHMRAAGCRTTDCTLEEFKNELIQLIEKEL